ncbi:UNVERIFIED_CONTAM: hypothetical protein Slati_2732200 [Sesamum latifolium]|uniref:Uncharacterized protein n=1 Tax=Sesamum latifolium TaxID=2727402 RepID=A0AAW2VYA7_9LAMI
MDYCKFCGEVRYKPAREPKPNRKKTPYAILGTYRLPLDCKRLYASKATAEHMTWHANHWTKEGSVCHPSDAEAWSSEHKWTKKNIFWELAYWGMYMIWHNLDVMYIEKNVFDNIFNTVIDIKGKMKDNLNAQKDLKIICNRPELVVDERRSNVKLIAVYTLTNDQKRRICEWIHHFNFSD